MQLAKVPGISRASVCGTWLPKAVLRKLADGRNLYELSDEFNYRIEVEEVQAVWVFRGQQVTSEMLSLAESVPSTVRLTLLTSHLLTGTSAA